MFQGAIRDDCVRNPQNFVDVITLIYVDMFVAYTWLRLTASTVDLQHYLWLEIAISALHVLANSSRTRVGFVWK